MTQRFTGRFTIAVLLATAIPIFDQTEAAAQSAEPVYDSAIEVSTSSDQFLEPSSTDTLQTFLRSTTTVRVNAHEFENRQAATVYINNIPVLTYTDAADATDLVSGWLPPSDEPVVVQTATDSTVTATDGAIAEAATMAAQLEYMYQNGYDTQLTAHWQEGSYVVMAGDSPLVTLGDTVQLPAATDSEAENALQVTNRLRRLLGDGTTEPVTEVIGRPAPEPPQRVAAVRSSYNGVASWYGPGFHGRMSASGEYFNQHAMTAAHRTLPFGTQVRVTNMSNGRQVVVRINDRGPFSGGRIIDLSAGAASAIGLRSAGVGQVRIEVLN